MSGDIPPRAGGVLGAIESIWAGNLRIGAPTVPYGSARAEFDDVAPGPYGIAPPIGSAGRKIDELEDHAPKPGPAGDAIDDTAPMPGHASACGPASAMKSPGGAGNGDGCGTCG